jgi:Effector Associated Constant Component 1
VSIIEVAVSQSDNPTDLREWLAMQAVNVAGAPPGTMGAAEILAISAGTLAAQRIAITAIVEWVRSRRSSVEIRLTGDRMIRIDASRDPEEILRIIQEYGSSSDQSGD